MASADFSKHRWMWLLLPMPWAIGAAFGISSAISDFYVAKHERTADALVIARHPEDHQSYDLRWTFQGSSYVGRVYPQQTQLFVGERVSAHFDPQAPQAISLSSFQVQGERHLGPVPLELLGFTAFGCFAFWRWKIRPKRSSPET